jgi:hypothetical protein
MALYRCDMAQVFGESGRNATEQFRARTKRLLLAGFVAIAALAFIGGYAIGAALPIRGFPPGWVVLISILMALLMWLIGKWATGKIDTIDRERISWRKGAVGEALVAATLTELPNNFVVVNDISKRFGNIDHVVIGPTGVYVVDAKNWTGSVKANAQGELMLNEKPLPKPPIKSLLGLVMDFQSKLYRPPQTSI